MEDLVYHVVSCIQLIYLLCFRVYKSYHYGFKYNIYFRFRIQTHAYVIQFFLSCRQDSHGKYDIDRSHQSQIQYFHVIPLHNLLYYFPTVVFHTLHS